MGEWGSGRPGKSPALTPGRWERPVTAGRIIGAHQTQDKRRTLTRNWGTLFGVTALAAAVRRANPPRRDAERKSASKSEYRCRGCRRRSSRLLGSQTHTSDAVDEEFR